ncbi:MAG TPA: hypothetical protein PK971_07605 [Saprospiraceae bacterium]|nr:hypothetical protein [Saprospiraceae bacterium]
MDKSIAHRHALRLLLLAETLAGAKSHAVWTDMTDWETGNAPLCS